MLKSQTYRRFVYEKAFCGHSGCHTHSQRCGLRKKSPVQQEEPAAPVQEEAIVPEAPAEAEKSQDNVIHITPNQNQTQDGLEASWLDEPERIQTDLEEIVSCTYTLPHLTLESDDASAAANAVFDELSQTVISYAQETVYPAAQEKAAIGYVNGGYSISEENGTLIVSYTLLRLLFHGNR